MTKILARGPNFVFGAEFIKKTYGIETWEKMLAALPEESSRYWRGPLLATSAYPFVAFKAMLTALVEVVGSVPDQEIARMYEHIADRSLNTLYKVFFKMTDPSFVLKRYPILWKRFFTVGIVTVPEVASPGPRFHPFRWE